MSRWRRRAVRVNRFHDEVINPEAGGGVARGRHPAGKQIARRRSEPAGCAAVDVVGADGAVSRSGIRGPTQGEDAAVLITRCGEPTRRRRHRGARWCWRRRRRLGWRWRWRTRRGRLIFPEVVEIAGGTGPAKEPEIAARTDPIRSGIAGSRFVTRSRRTQRAVHTRLAGAIGGTFRTCDTTSRCGASTHPRPFAGGRIKLPKVIK